MSNIIYLSIKGKIQGLISEGCGSYASIGNKYQINHVDEIFVLQFDHSLSREYNVVHHPIKFYKPIDKSSPLLNAALSENEELSAVFNFYRVNSGGCIERFYTIECVSSQRYCNCLRISKGRLHYANAASDGWLS
ncbi:hypothetical protein G684_03337 [Escherichia coli HVH 4 (4-7276109)]|nr:type VI secretion system tube protein TssD [Escherichia coli]EQN15267.1 hypothetical protein G684_03337 [Escherichia coli HVH 4 (4-7276109)]